MASLIAGDRTEGAPAVRRASAVLAAMVEFDSEHVGQLMIYSRINGFVPPTPGQVATPEDGK